MGKVFSVNNGGEDIPSSEDDDDDNTEMKDETMVHTDDQILGQILNQYQTRHSIIDSQVNAVTSSKV